MIRPAVEQVMASVATRVAAIAPSLRPLVRFSQADVGQDVRSLPPSEAERKFRVSFRSLDDLSQIGGGVVTPGLADRRLRVDIEIAYPRQAESQSPEVQLASDAELLARAFGRSAVPVAPARRTVASSTRQDAADLIILACTIEVQYRDQE